MKKLTILLLLSTLWTKAQFNPQYYFGGALASYAVGKATYRSTGNKVLSYSLSLAVPTICGILTRNSDTAGQIISGSFTGNFILIISLTQKSKKHKYLTT